MFPVRSLTLCSSRLGRWLYLFSLGLAVVGLRLNLEGLIPPRSGGSGEELSPSPSSRGAVFLAASGPRKHTFASLTLMAAVLGSDIGFSVDLWRGEQMCNIYPVKAGLFNKIILLSEHQGRGSRSVREAQHLAAVLSLSPLIHEDRTVGLPAERGLFLQGPNMLHGAGRRNR